MMYYTGRVSLFRAQKQWFCSQNSSTLPLNRYIRKRYHNTGNSNIRVSRQASHLVKHTDIIPSSSTSIRVIVVVVELRTTHTTQARFSHVTCTAWAHVCRWWHPGWASRTRHVGSVCSRLNRFAIVDFCHSSHTSAPQSRVLVAVAPAVHSPLNQASLAAKARV